MENNYLYRSLTQDVRCLDNLTRTIMSTNFSETRSWLDPRKTFFDIDDINSFSVTDEAGRLKCLELIIDRLYLILNLNINFLDEFINNNTKLQKNVKKPKSLTLAMSANILWERIQQLCTGIQNSNLYKLQTARKNSLPHQIFVDKAVQAYSDIKHCKGGCKVAQECVHFLINELRSHKQDDYISEARKNIRSNIYELTQNMTMELVTSAIRSEIIDMVTYCGDIKLQLNKKEEIYQNLNCEYLDSLKKNDELLKKIQNLEKLKDEDITTVDKIQTKVNQLYCDKLQMEINLKSEKQNCITLTEQLEKSNTALEDSRFELQKLQKKLNSTLDNQELESAEKELWKIQFSNSQAENKKLKSLNSELETKLKNLECEVEVITENFDKLNENIERSSKEIDINADAYENLLKRTKSAVESGALISEEVFNQMECYSSTNNTPANDFEVQGHPLLDMMKQVEINSLNMQELEQENTSLMGTIRKFQYHVTENSYDNK